MFKAIRCWIGHKILCWRIHYSFTKSIPKSATRLLYQSLTHKPVRISPKFWW